MTTRNTAPSGFPGRFALALLGLALALYLGLGWLVLIALKPMLASVSWVAMLLLAIGGVVYTTGVLFYVQKKLKYFRAIWHGHVVAAAGVHWAAILVGVVLTAGAH